MKPKNIFLSSVNNISFKYKEHQGTTDTSYIQYSIVLFHNKTYVVGTQLNGCSEHLKQMFKMYEKKKLFICMLLD